MLHNNNEYVWRRIAAFCNFTTGEESEEMRQTMFSVCKRWRYDFKMHLWTHPTSAYCKSLRACNYRLANRIWDYSGDCIDCSSETLVTAVFDYGKRLEAKRLVWREDFDPSSRNNHAILHSSRKGYVEVVRLLLQDSRVDPSAQDNSAIA